MTKKQSKIKFTLLAVFAAICIFLTCFSFHIPFTEYRFTGFLKAIALSQDFDNGYVAIFDATVEEGQSSELDKRIDSTILKLNQFLGTYGFANLTITKQGTSKIRIETSVDSDTSVFDVIGSPSPVSIRRAEGDENEILSKDIEDAYAFAQQTSETSTTWGVVIKFTEEGKDKFYNLTNEAANDSSNQTISIYIGGSLYSSPSVSEAMSEGVTFITGSNITSESEANKFAMKILSGSFETSLNLSFEEKVSPKLGENAILFALIAVCAIMVIACIYLIVKYGVNGIIASFANVFYFCIYAFLLQLVPIIVLSTASLIAIILSFAILTISHITIFENTKREYAVGKKIPASIKSGFKKSLMPIVDIHIVLAIISIGIYFLGTTPIKDFAITLLLGVIASMFTSYVITKSFINLYLPLNSTKAKAYKFVREVEINE